MLKSADGLIHRARFVSADSGGRNYQLAVPLDMPLNLKLSSSVSNIFDQNGAPLQPSDQVGVQTPSPSAAAALTFTVRQK